MKAQISSDTTAKGNAGRRSDQHKNSFDISRWTNAPLRLQATAWLKAAPEAVFHDLSDPLRMCHVFPWMDTVQVRSKTAEPSYGPGARRYCHFGNGMVLEEVIVSWEPPFRYAYKGVDETHPFGMLDHLGVIRCDAQDGGTLLTWQHYFDHHNVEAMSEQLGGSMKEAITGLAARYNGDEMESHQQIQRGAQLEGHGFFV